MGTNYYLHEAVCEHCGRGNDPLHIGKSSAGWCFSLHVGRDAWDDHPRSLAAWQERWSRDGVLIKDEYGVIVTPEAMLATITERARLHDAPMSDEWYRQNRASRGPNGLARHGYGAIPGDGTYDLVFGDFS